MEDLMRKYLVITLLIGFLLFAMTSCGGAVGPKSAVDAFMTAAKAGDSAKMTSLCTGDIAKIWKLFEDIRNTGMPGGEEMDISVELKDVKEFKIEEKEVTGDTGKVDVTYDENMWTFVCTLIDGKWLISDIVIDGDSFASMVSDMEDALEMMKNMPEMPDMPEMPGMMEPEVDEDGE